LNKDHSESERDVFKKSLIELLDKISIIEKSPNDESEEHLKNNVRDFLRDTFYKETNAINTKDKKDLVIHLDKTTNSEVGVIIEAKRPSNTHEMISINNMNKKAFHEIILYYLNERKEKKNFNLKHLAITNIYEWYIIDANLFDKHIYRNTQIAKLYQTKQKDNKDNPWFYEEIARQIEKLDAEIPCIYFDIRNYETILRNEDKKDDKELLALYKILSPRHLLKLEKINDSNTLNEKFYKELLHIIGLEEVKEGNKNIIRRKTDNRNAASFIESVIDELKVENILNRLPDPSVYGENSEEQQFNVALELSLIWINRILFLKLLEGQLLTYHNNDKEFAFLNYAKIRDFDELFNLFHRVLAVNISDRKEKLKEKFKNVPYLNSSLFEISELENQTIKINSLDDNELLELHPNTILKEVKKSNNELPLLEYLFRFLNAYDFAGEGTEDWQSDNKPLINASVLGKVFEKINGYKDGSIFTPGFITMYMCRESIRLALVQKFNEVKKWNIKKFDEIYNLIDNKEEANQIINSLKICDPAVGSGHFLVSALNEIIAIKSELKLLMDDNGKLLRDYRVEVINDELLITHEEGDLFIYNPRGEESNRVQKSIFHEKQKIIENCLFGVDINPNSVKICRLRLWIELLKHAYYKDIYHKELETLPNIDINIKCGNSLVSRFPLDADLSKALKSIKYNITQYRDFVRDYKQVKDYELKKGLDKIIQSIKNDFRTEIPKYSDSRVLKIQKLSAELFLLTGPTNLFQDAMAVYGKNGKENKEKELEKIHKIEAEINKLSQELDEIKNNIIFKNAFEWRFEFPEVLDDYGNFIGFDIVIGNPPYIQLQKDGGQLSKALERFNYKTFNRLGDIYMIFYEKGLQLLKERGFLTLITSSQWMKAGYGISLRSFLLEFNNLNLLALGPNIFENATVDTNILVLQKAGNEGILKGSIIKSTEEFNEYSFEYHQMPYINENSWTILNPIKKSISERITSNGIKLIEWDIKMFRGILTGLNEAFIINESKKDEIVNSDKKSKEIIKPIFRGREIEKYYTKWEGDYLISTFPALKINISDYPGVKNYLQSFGKRIEQIGEEYIEINGEKVKTRKKTSNKWFETQDQIGFYEEFYKEKVIWKRIGSQLRFTYSDSEIYSLDSTCIATGEKIKYLTALLNSKVCRYQLFEHAPRTGMGDLLISVQAIEPLLVHYPSKETEEQINKLVDQIITNNKEGKDTTALENEIDKLVYELYGLSEEEIEVVEESLTEKNK